MDEMVTRQEAYKSYWTVLFCGDVYYAVEESLSLDVDHGLNVSVQAKAIVLSRIYRGLFG